MVELQVKRKLRKSSLSGFVRWLSLGAALMLPFYVLLHASVGIKLYKTSILNLLKDLTVEASAGLKPNDTDTSLIPTLAAHTTTSAGIASDDESQLLINREANITFETMAPTRSGNATPNIPVIDATHVKADRETNATASSCSTKECGYYHEAEPLSRAFPDHRTYCTNTSSANDRWQGLLLVKVPKAASSTSAGVALRIAQKYKCAVQWQHRLAQDYRPHHANKTFMFTTVRDPAARAVSSIFFHVVSQQNKKPTDKLVLEHLTKSSDFHYGSLSGGRGGFSLRYTSLQSIPEESAWSPSAQTVVLCPDQVRANVKHVVDNYDFLLVVERMDESLVAMSMIMGIELGDILTTASKVAGSTYHLTRNPKRCVATVKSFVSPAVRKHLNSGIWYAQNYGDYVLHAAANLSLNKTIERLGADRFQDRLDKFRTLRVMEKKMCAPQVQFPCSNIGEPQPKVARESCYKGFYDFGCGHKCHNDMLRNMTA